MEAVIKKLSLNTYEAKRGDNKGKKFKKLDFTCDVLVNAEKGDIKTRSGSMSEEYAKKYFKYCNVTTQEALNKTVDVVLAKRQYEKDGVTHIIEYIKFLNFIDKDGKAIIMPRSENVIDF